jgi:uncharacterized membrane protein
MIPRRHEISRLEAFSDAVFAFALALLVVSVEPPASYAQLVDRMIGGVSFACCFTLLVWIWYEHSAFFRRYGLQARTNIAHHLISAGVGVLSLALASFAPLELAPIAPTAFCLMGPAHYGFGSISGKKRSALGSAPRG